LKNSAHLVIKYKFVKALSPSMYQRLLPLRLQSFLGRTTIFTHPRAVTFDRIQSTKKYEYGLKTKNNP